MNVILSGVVGSTAYGLAGPDSDIDRLGVFAAPTGTLHGLHPPTDTRVTSKPDTTQHEARKYALLALGGNPTVSELMWLNSYETHAAFGEELIGIRSAFLSAKRVRNAYLGYASQQFRKLENREDGSFSADTRKRTAKHARHLKRLCHQGYELCRSGHLEIRLEHPQAFLDFGEAVAAGNIYSARAMIDIYEERFDATTSPLPNQPYEAVVEDWLRRVRIHYFNPPIT